MALKKQNEQPSELQAVAVIYDALKALDPPVQLRALRYAAEMLGISLNNTDGRHDRRNKDTNLPDQDSGGPQIELPPNTLQTPDDDHAEGINAVALKWIRRSDIDVKELQQLFSLGIDEIDLVAKKIPGKSKRERLRNVILLKGVAAYLSSGTPRISNDQLKEASLHYNAYDVANHAKYLKDFSGDVSGTKESGYTLSARGLTAATELVKEMLSSKSA